MRYAGVLFDLFGTLVPPFRMAEHRAVLAECASILGIPFDECYRFWGEAYLPRIRGDFATVSDNFRWVAEQAGQHVTHDGLTRVEAVYGRFTAESLTPVTGAIETLEWLSKRRLRIGLVSNCGADTPKAWGMSVFSRYFDQCAFSCELGAVKPEPAIYRSVLDALSLPPGADTLCRRRE